RREVDVEAADRAGIPIAVVDDDDLAAGAVTPDPAQQPPVGADHGDHLAAVGTDHHRAGIATDRLGADVAGPVSEAIQVVATDICLPAGVADDDAVRLVVDRTATFDRL